MLNILPSRKLNFYKHLIFSFFYFLFSLPVLNSQTTYSFTNAGATGSVGPTQTQLNTAYLSTNLNGMVTSTLGIQTWTVPNSGPYRIIAMGAQGYGTYGGRGASMAGDFTLTAGQVLKIIVGQQGMPPFFPGTNQFGGGGGSFVTDISNAPLIVAGGGGGSWAGSFTGSSDGTVSINGNPGLGGSYNGAGGIAGGGGGTGSDGDGGGGLLGDGLGPKGGKSFLNGGNGGAQYGIGGFGGGGGSSAINSRRGSGGGGYSGGGGSSYLSTTTGTPEAGGGGSYNAGANQLNSSGVNYGYGKVYITELCAISLSVSANPVCAGTSVTLTTNATNTYTWSTGSSNSVIVVSPTISTNYSLTAGSPFFSCTASSVLSLTVNAGPALSVNSGSMCSGSVFTLVPSGAASYTFAGGSSTVSPVLTSTYSVAGTGTNGCVSTAVANVNVYPRPVIGVNSGTICSGSFFAIIPTGADFYSISGGSFFVSPATNSVYVVTGTNSTGCVSSNTVTSNVTVLSSPTISVNSGTICSGQTFTIIPSGASSYTIQGGSATVSPPSSSSFSVAGTNSLGCISSPVLSSVFISVSPTISASSGSICAGDVFTISPFGANTYFYSSLSSTVNPASNTVYTVYGTGLSGCYSNTISANVTVAPLPTISIASGTLCSGRTYTLSPSGASFYTFSGGSAIVSPLTNTLYSVSGTSSVGCLASNTAIATITVFTTPVISVNSGSICSGQTFTMFPTGAISYSFQNGSAVVSPATSTTYSVAGSNALGCVSNTVPCNVIVSITPIISVLSGSVCSGNVFTISPSGASTYTFSSLSATVNPLSTSSYSITGTNAQGCISSNTAVVTVSVVPLPSVSVNSGSICLGGIFTMSPSGASSYVYSSGSSTVSPLNTSNFSIIGFGPSGCASSNTAISIVMVYALPQVSIAGPSLTCLGVSQTWTANGAQTYTWNTTSQGSTINVSPSVTSVFSVTGTNINGCINSAQKNITVNSLPVLTISGAGVICQGLFTSLLVSGSAVTYTWSDGTFGNLITVGPTVSTIYTVTGTNANGCSSSTTQIVLVNTIPPVNANANTTSACLGDAVILNGSGANTYTWSGGIINNTAFYPSATNNYTVNGTGSNGCKNSATIQVAVNPLPQVTILSSVMDTICNGDEITLNAGGANIYAWSTGNTTPKIIISPSVTTNYTVTGIDGNGCKVDAYFKQYVLECTGVSKNRVENEISIYPNPFNSGFSILTKGTSSSLRFELFNNLGQLILEGPIELHETHLDIMNTVNGIYFLKVYTKTQLIQNLKIFKLD